MSAASTSEGSMSESSMSEGSMSEGRVSKGSMVEGSMGEGSVSESSMICDWRSQAKTLQDKRIWRRSASIHPLLPKGAAGFASFPRREEERFGEEGEEGDTLFDAAMAAYSANEFGDSHCQQRVLKQKFGQVGIFGEWLQRHKFGSYIDWVEDKSGSYVAVAVERNGKLRIPSAAALNQYVLVQVHTRLSRLPSSFGLDGQCLDGRVVGCPGNVQCAVNKLMWLCVC